MEGQISNVQSGPVDQSSPEVQAKIEEQQKDQKPVLPDAPNEFNYPDDQRFVQKSLHQTYLDASSLKPEDASKIKNYSASTGQTPSFISNNLDSVDKQAKYTSSYFDQLKHDSPNTASFVSDPFNMAIHQDDLDNLKEHEKILEDSGQKTGIMQGIFNTGKSFAAGVWENLVALPIKAVYRAENEIYHSLDTIPPGADPSLLKDIRDRDQTQELIKFNNSFDSFTKAVDDTNSSINTSISDRLQNHDYVGAAFHAVSTVSRFLPVAIGAELTGGTSAVPLAFGATSGTQQALSGELQAREEGATKGQAMIDGAIQGSIAGSLNYVLGGPWFNKLLNEVPQAGKAAFARQLALNLTKSAGTGIALTWGQGLANAAADQATGVNPNAINEFMPKTHDLLLESLIFPALTLAHESPAALKSFMPESKAKAIQKQIEQLEVAPSQEFIQKVAATATDHKTLSDLLKAAKENKINAKTPEEFKGAIRHLTDQNPNAPSDVRFNPEEVQKLFATHNQDTFEFFDQKKEEMGKALQNGYDFSMPLEDFLAKANHPMAEKLLEHAKLNPENLSVAEIKEEAVKEEEIQTEAKKKAVNLISELAKEPEKTGAGGFLDKIKEGLRGIGERILPASVLSRGLKNLSERSGTDLDTVLKDFQYQILNAKKTPHYAEGLSAFGIKPESKENVLFQGPSIAFQSRLDELEGIKPAGLADNNEIFTGNNHGEVVRRGAAVGKSFGKSGQLGFRLPDGSFITRAEAKERFGFSTSEELHAMRGTGINEKDAVYFQTGKAERGGIGVNPLAGNPNGLSFEIWLNKLGDKSTFFHEMAHSFLYVMHNLSEREQATPEIKEMMKTTLDWFGVKDWGEVGKKEHELFARAFEYRLWAGNVPVPSMEKAFDTFAKLMRKVYPSSQHMEEYLNGKLTDQMRSVYDRILASDDEIRDAKEKMGYNPEAPLNIPEDMKKEWEAVNDKMDSEARKKLASEMLKDGSARTADGLELERQKAIEQATDDISKTPVFGAMDDLKSIYPDKDGRPMDEDVREAAQLIRKGERPQDYSKWVDSAFGHGFASPQDLANKIINTPKSREELIEGKVSQEMAKFHLIKETINNPKSKDAAIQAMLGTKGPLDLLTLELQAYKEKMGEKTEDEKQMSANEKKISDLKQKVNDLKIENKIVSKELLKERLENLSDASKNPQKYKDKAQKTINQFEELNQKIQKFVQEVEQAKQDSGLEALNIKFQKELKDQLDKMSKEIGLPDKTESRRKERQQMVADANAKAVKTLDNASQEDASNYRIYITAERRAAVKAKEYELKGKFADAYDEKQKQIDNHALAALALKNRRLSNKILKNFADLASRGVDMKGMSKGFISPVDAILEKFHLKDKAKGPQFDMTQTAQMLADAKLEDGTPKFSDEDIAHQTAMVRDKFTGNWRQESPNEFVERISKEDENIKHYVTPDLMQTGDTHYKDLNMGQLKKLSNAVNMIVSIGRNWDKSMTGEISRGMSEVAAMTAESINKNTLELHKNETVLGGKAPMSLRRIVNAIIDNPFVLEYGIQLPHLADIFDGKDPNGLFHNNVIRLLRTAERGESKTLEEVENILKPIYQEHLPYEQRLKDQNIPIMTVEYKGADAKPGDPPVRAQFTKEDIRQIAKYWGSEAGRERLLAATGWTDEHVEKTLFDVLDKNDWDLIKKETKALHDYFWPKTVAYMMDRYKIEPTPVQNRPFQTKYGEMPGWYTHIEYDPTSPGKVLTRDRDVNERRRNFIMYPDKNFLKIRTQTAQGMILDLSGNAQKNYISDAAHFLNYNDAIRDVRRITDNKAVEQSIRNGLGVGGLKTVKNTINYQAAGEEAPRGLLERMLRSARVMWTMGNIPFRPLLATLKWSTDQWSVFNRIKESTGGEITAKDWATTYKDFGLPVMNPKLDALREYVNAKDANMATLHKNFDYAIRTVSMTPPGMLERGSIRLASKIAEKTGIPLDDVTANLVHLGDWTQYHSFIAERTAMNDIAPRLWKLGYDRAVLKMDEESAKSYAYNLVDTLLSTGSKLSHPGIYQSGEFGRALAPAYTFMSMIFNHLWKQGKFAQLEYTKGNALVANYTVAKTLGFIAGLGVIEFYNRWLWANKSGMSDEDKKKKFATDFKRQMVETPLASFPIFGYPLSQVMGQMATSKKFDPKELHTFIPDETLGDYTDAAHSMLGLMNPGKMSEGDWEKAGDAMSMISKGRYPKLLNSWIFNFIDNAKGMPFVMQDLTSRKLKKPSGYNHKE